MTKAKAIRQYCFECAGEMSLEVTLCSVVDCPLWPYRTGHGLDSAAYRQRLALAIKNHAPEMQSLLRAGVDMALFAVQTRRRPTPSHKLAPVDHLSRGDA